MPVSSSSQCRVGAANGLFKIGLSIVGTTAANHSTAVTGKAALPRPVEAVPRAPGLLPQANQVNVHAATQSPSRYPLRCRLPMRCRLPRLLAPRNDSSVDIINDY